MILTVHIDEKKMATITRKGPQRTEFEIIDNSYSPTGNKRLQSNEIAMKVQGNKNNVVNDANESKSEDIQKLNTKTPTPSFDRVSLDQVITVKCDSCSATNDLNMIMYCRECKQKLCDSCLYVHHRLGGTRNHCEFIETCWTEAETLQKSVTIKLMKERELSLEELSTKLSDELGIQVCLLFDTNDLEIRAPSIEVLEVAIDTLCAVTKQNMKRVSYGAIKWTLHGSLAYAITKLFKDQLESLIDTYNLGVSIKQETEKALGPMHIELEKDIELTLTSSFDNYYAVNCEIEGLKDEIETLRKVEILRPKQDEFRMRLYTIMKENSNDVLCHIEKEDNISKLVIQGIEDTVINNVKQEFLSLYCKECSSCKRESSRPVFLDCKHVLCQNCVTKSAYRNDGLRCPVCADASREKTPVTSLQLKCMEVLENHLTQNVQSNTKRSTRLSKKQSSVAAPQVSVKIPKYLLQKWTKLTGGISRLKGVIENTYGLKVAGVGHNMKIYGEYQEILDLAVQSLEKFNESPNNGITQRLVEKTIEWRIREEHARIIYFLYNKELYDLMKKFSSVTIRVFTESEPMIVDVRCGYEEFLKVNYEMEELENDIKNLHTDECILSKNFYNNIKIKEFLQSKRRDEKVHCNHVDKNNVNAVVFRGRKKEYIVAAKEELMKW